MNILSLDTATKTGYCIAKDSIIVEHGVWDCHATDKGKRNSLIRQKIENAIAEHNITHVVAEDIFRQEGKESAYEVLCFFRGLIQMIAYEKQIKCDFVRPEHIKRYACGRSKDITKEMMMRAAQKLGYTPADHNAADAIHLMRCWAEWFNKIPIIR